MITSRQLWMSLGAACLLGGCFVVDDKLWKDALDKQDAEVEEDPEMDASTSVDGANPTSADGGAPDGAAGDDAMTNAAPDAVVLSYADQCNAPNTRQLTETTTVTVDTRDLLDDINDTVGCTGYKSPGNDAFLKIRVGVGEKWHFHVHSQGGSMMPANPVLYLTQNCDARSCTNFSDTCPDDSDEHFTFTASAAGNWFIGIDDRNPGGAIYRIDALRTTCGDGNPEHGEACDDGNRNDGDGCDKSCRKELPLANGTEVEPNDDLTVANMLRFPSTGTKEMLISASLGGCPVADYYGVNVGNETAPVPKDSRLRASIVLPANCTASAPKVRLITATGGTVMTTATVNAGQCPTITTTTNQPEGAYYVVVDGTVTGTSIGYQLKVEVLPPI